jgi:predicted Fe-Mo cluster-binding NifX family protein
VIIAVTVRGKGLDAMVEMRFGRAPGFLIVDNESGEVEYLDNASGVGAPQGAGIQAAKQIADRGAQVLLTGHCGPNAFRALQAAGIRVCTGLTGGTARDAVERFQAGGLHEAQAADVQGHW